MERTEWETSQLFWSPPMRLVSGACGFSHRFGTERRSNLAKCAQLLSERKGTAQLIVPFPSRLAQLLGTSWRDGFPSSCHPPECR